MDNSKHIVFYDGDCGFCNFWVAWVLRNDKKDQFLFSSLQSETGQSFLKERNLNQHKFDTIYLWKPNEYYLKKSQAVGKIAKVLGGKYSIFSQLNFLPTVIADGLYDIVAKNRKKLMAQNCVLPSAEERKKFLL